MGVCECGCVFLLGAQYDVELAAFGIHGIGLGQQYGRMPARELTGADPVLLSWPFVRLVHMKMQFPCR